MAYPFDELNMLGLNDRVTGPSVPGFLGQILKHGTTRNAFPVDLTTTKPAAKGANQKSKTSGFGTGGGARIEDFMATPAENATPLAPGSIARVGSNTFTNVQSDIDAARAAGVNVTESAPLTGQGGVSTASGGTFSTAPSAAFLDPALSAQLSAARTAAADRGDFDAVANSYRVNGGTFAGETGAQVRERELRADLLRQIRGGRSATRINSATSIFNSLLGLEGNKLSADARLASAAAKHGIDVQKLILDAISTGATARKANAEATTAETKQELARRAGARGASESEVAAILAGRSTGNQYTFLPSLTGNDVIVGNRGTGNTTLQTPSRQTSVQRDATGPYILQGGQKRYLTPEELARMQK